MENKYFAAKSSEECVKVLESKIEKWMDYLESSNIIEKVQKSWAYYHGSFDSNDIYGSSHKIKSDGDQGELLNFPVNHYKNIAQHMLNMTTANRPSMSARAINTDYKSTSQTILANGLLDYYMRERGLEDVIKLAAEYAIVLSEGWIKMDWDATSGDTYGYNEETKTYIYNGDIKYKALNICDVIRDVHKNDSDEHDWLMTKTYKNRYDLIAKFPEFEQEILKIKTRDNEDIFRFGASVIDTTDDIPVYEFYHNRTDSVQDGRYIMFLNSKCILVDVPLPYRFIPLFPVMPSKKLGTPFGHTILFELLPIQEAINMLNSIILTNQNAFGVQNVLVPRNADINLTQIVGGLNIIEYNPGVGKPEPMNLTNTPAEIFNMLSRLESTMETISGINQVTRGNPEASLRSGSALALIQAQAVQFASGLQQAYIRLIESVGTGTIKMLQDYADAPRVAAIVGVNNKMYLREFTSEDLTNVGRVVVEITNPISKTTAGRMQMATDLIQYQIIDNPKDYFTVMNTGQLDAMTQGTQSELAYIQLENEYLSRGEGVPALYTDSHLMHIKEHKAVLNDPELRKDPELVNVVMSHIQEHVDLLRNTDPGLLQTIGEQPLEPQQGLTPNQQQQANMKMSAEMVAPPPTGVDVAQEQSMPNMPSPPGEFADMPITPQEGMETQTG